ncbi:MAG: hypothetical protein LBE22_08270 [Azoarcus sp.]|jgi:acetyltransferase-like isoleucine patch superfamily enzyme|nr:hypothetical protein [Azoarcus sp.]
MNAHCNDPPHNEPAKILREWLDAGAQGKLTLFKEDFEDDDFSLLLCKLVYSGPLHERLLRRWRSFCVWVGRHTPFSRWKEFWFRRAGASIGKNVFFAPDTEIDMLFPQLVTLEDGAVMGLGSMVMAHIYSPDRIVIARAAVKRYGLVGGRAILAITSIGEGSVLGLNSYTVKPIPDGCTAIGVPAVCQKQGCQTTV